MTPSSSLTPLLRWRMLKNMIAEHAITVGGLSVIAAIVMIFVYLLYVVLPMFEGAEIERVSNYSLPEMEQTVYLAMEEQTEVGMQVTRSGEVLFFNTENGKAIKRLLLPLPADTRILSFAEADPASDILAIGLSNGEALIFKHAYQLTYPNDIRVITPRVEYPMGEASIKIDEDRLGLTRLAIQMDDEQATVVATTEDKRIVLKHFSLEESLLDDEISWESTLLSVPYPKDDITDILLNKEQRDLFLLTADGELSFYDVSDWEEGPELIQHLSVAEGQQKVTGISFLVGDISLLIASDNGTISQWFPVRDDAGKRIMTHIRTFSDLKGSVHTISGEQQRKGFIAANETGQLGLFHSTAHRTLLVETIADEKINYLGLGPRANAVLLQTDKEIYFYRIHNEYPEVSWSALWGKVWYESYPKPEHIWQSSSASNDFEPKLSLIPISFGTLKAAFYAMLIAIPLSIMGAIFTAYFMAPKMRQVVKPTIEIMEALPTVILGFLAGLWLAPFIESHLPGAFALLLLMPIGLLVAAWIWQLLPRSVRYYVPDGWEAALLIPVVIIVAYVSLSLSPLVEEILFAGDMRIWMNEELGISYDQRNSLIVGIAMGFAVIPTIFSITEDAIFAVPKHLIQGSLALGATPWQTMMRVVLLTASPGIFSAIMIGLGRAVGETMIVLMATGNTPVMDFSIFQGMRTLSANIAVEMPESEVGSTHYRVLFLAALVLFGFTFVFNTAAEIVRQRLRKRYSSL